MLLRRMLIDSISPFVHCNRISAFLVNWAVSCLQKKWIPIVQKTERIYWIDWTYTLSMNVQPCNPVIWHRLTSGTFKYVCSNKLNENVTSLLGLYTPMWKCSSFSRKISRYVIRKLYEKRKWVVTIQGHLTRQKENAYGKFHMDRVKSLSISDKTASTSPLCRRSGARSSVHRVIRANPCCGPKLHGPNCAACAKKIHQLIYGCIQLCESQCTYEIRTEYHHESPFCHRIRPICCGSNKIEENIIDISFSLKWNEL